jgi:hypothetical protein
MNIQSRDIKILLLIYHYDRVGVRQIHQAFFTSRSSAYKRLRTLAVHGFVSPRQLNATSPRGTGIYLYGLGPVGKRALAEYLGLETGDLIHLSYIRDPVFADHHLAICDFRLKLEHACRAYGVQLVHWETERQVRARGVRPEPDGIFSLITEQRRFRYELDMGTAHKGKVVKKLKAYAKDRDRTLVLWDVPDQKRANYLREWALSVATSERVDPTIFLLSVRPENPLDPVWTVPGIEKPVSLLGGQR